jgi:hypothetical protein
MSRGGAFVARIESFIVPHKSGTKSEAVRQNLVLAGLPALERERVLLEVFAQ